MNDDLRRWLPWIGVAVVAIIVIAIIAVNQGDDDDEAAADTTTTVAEETTTTAAEETTTTEGETTTTEGETTTTGAPVAFEPVPLKLGTLLPQTGSLAPIVESLEQSIKMGVEEINAVSPGLIEVEYADSGTDPNVASAAVDGYLTGDFTGILGAAGSSITLSVVDKVQESSVLMCSGSNTDSALSASAYDPYYTRTAPSDSIQAPTLGDLMIEDGVASTAIVFRQDAYGQGFADLLSTYLEGSGVTVSDQIGYAPDATSFADVADSVAASGAETAVLITFAEGGQVLLDLQGKFDGALYATDGFKDTVGADQLGGNVALLEGIKGTAPAAAPENGEADLPGPLRSLRPGCPDDLLVTLLRLLDRHGARHPGGADHRPHGRQGLHHPGDS